MHGRAVSTRLLPCSKMREVWLTRKQSHQGLRSVVVVVGERGRGYLLDAQSSRVFGWRWAQVAGGSANGKGAEISSHT